MKDDWRKMRADLERDAERAVADYEAGSASSGTVRSRNKASGVLGHIIFWVVIIGGAIALFEVWR